MNNFQNCERQQITTGGNISSVFGIVGHINDWQDIRFPEIKQENFKNLPITTPSTLGPNALPKSGGRTGVDSKASRGRSRRHFIRCEYGNSGEQLTWWETIAA